MLVSSTSHFNGVGSHLTVVMLHCYKLTVLTARKQFKNNKQHTFICIAYIGRMPEWSKALISGTSYFNEVGLNPTAVMVQC